MSIRVLLAEDQMLIRQGICSLLELSARVEVVHQACDGSEVSEAVACTHPDLLLLDIRMPLMSGIEALLQIREQGNDIPAIMLTTFNDDELLLQSVKAGARGFLLKDVSLENLIIAIEAVYKGGTYFQSVLPETVMKSLAKLSADFPRIDEPEELTGKELEILRFIAKGYSNHEISAVLHKSEGTVKNQVSAVLAKLGVRDRTRAVLRAIELGLMG